MIEICPSDLHDPEVLALIEQLNAELSAMYPEPGATHFRLDPDEVAPGRGAFFVARLNGHVVGCGALRLQEGGAAEIKRMFTLRAARRRGVARALMAALEQAARDLGARRLVLETGVRQVEAVALYGSIGFERIEPFGEYVDSPLSLCMGKDLAAGAAGAVDQGEGGGGGVA